MPFLDRLKKAFESEPVAEKPSEQEISKYFTDTEPHSVEEALLEIDDNDYFSTTYSLDPVEKTFHFFQGVYYSPYWMKYKKEIDEDGRTTLFYSVILFTDRFLRIYKDAHIIFGIQKEEGGRVPRSEDELRKVLEMWGGGLKKTSDGSKIMVVPPVGIIPYDTIYSQKREKIFQGERPVLTFKRTDRPESDVYGLRIKILAKRASRRTGIKILRIMPTKVEETFDTFLNHYTNKTRETRYKLSKLLSDLEIHGKTIEYQVKKEEVAMNQLKCGVCGSHEFRPHPGDLVVDGYSVLECSYCNAQGVLNKNMYTVKLMPKEQVS